MKNCIVIIFLSLVATCGDIVPAFSTGGNQSVLINGNDSIIFNVTEADCFFDKIQFPVYINSDEDIFAIDFAMKFDVTRIAFDSLIVLKPYLLASINYNTSDSTLRFSCFSIQPVESGEDLINLRFRKITPMVDSVGFNYITTFLNGDSCSNRVNQYISHPVLTPAGPLNINTGDSITLQVDSLPGYSYMWSTGDTSTTIRISSQGLYSVTATNIHGCTSSTSITVNPGISLPVELLYFRCESKEKSIQLEWATASETENDFFTVERTNKGNEWSARVEGKGNTHALTFYSVLDETPVEGYNYYQLMQTDYNGDSRIVGYTSCDHEQNVIGFTVYPNPAAKELNIEAMEDGLLQICTLSGNAVSKLIPVNHDTRQVIDISYLQPGIYQVTLQTESKRESRKLFIE